MNPLYRTIAGAAVCIIATIAAVVLRQIEKKKDRRDLEDSREAKRLELESAKTISFCEVQTSHEFAYAADLEALKRASLNGRKIGLAECKRTEHKRLKRYWFLLGLAAMFAVSALSFIVLSGLDLKW